MQYKINWYDLNDAIVIRIDKSYQEKLLALLLKDGQSVKMVANVLDLNRSQIFRYLSGNSNFSVETLKKIFNHLNLNRNELTSHITSLGRKHRRIKSPKLPFNMHSVDGAALRSIVNSEGSILPGRGTTLRIKVPEISMLKSAIIYSKSIFGESDIKIQKTKDQDTFEIYLPSIISDCLKLSGLVGGKRSVTNPGVPSDILNGYKELKRVYLGWSFACEMEASHKVIKLCRYVNITDLLSQKEIKALHIGMNFRKDISDEILDRLSIRPPKLLTDEDTMLKQFGIDRPLYFSSLWKYKNGKGVSAKWSIVISNLEYIKKLKEIGLPLKEKEAKINNIINSYVSENILQSPKYKRTYTLLCRIYSKNSKFKPNDIAKLMQEEGEKWPREKTARHMHILSKCGLIKRYKTGFYTMTRPLKPIM